MIVPLLLALVVGGAAVGCLVIGSSHPEDSYGASVWANAGTTLLLFLPLIFVERLLERRVDKVERRVDTAKEATDESIGKLQTSVDQLSELSRRSAERLDARIEAEFAEATGPPRKIFEDPSFRSVYDAITHGVTYSAITDKVFVPLREHELTLSFARARGEKQCLSVVAIPDGDAAKAAGCTWCDGESVEDLFENLYVRMQDEHAAPPKLDPKPVLSSLAHTLDFAARRRQRNPRKASLEPVVGIPTEHWFVTRFGLEHIGEPATRFKLTDVFNERLRADPPTDVPHADELQHALWAADANIRRLSKSA
jgi:hypothetical protein